MTIKRINEFPEGSGSLSNDDVFLFMDDPSGSGVTKKISLSQISSAIGGGGEGSSFDAAVEWTMNHTIADGTRYLANDLVYSSGNLYRAKFDNESIPVTDTTYWENVGPGYRLNIDGRDIPNIPNPFDQDLNTTNTPTFVGVNLTNGTTLAQGTYDNNTGGGSGISLNCYVGYELNWQGGHLKSTWSNGDVANILIDSPIEFPGTGLDNLQIDSSGITFSDGSTQISAPPVKDITSGNGISISVSSGNYTVASNGEASIIQTSVFNKTGSQIPKFSVVYINGGQGDQPTVGLAVASGEMTSNKTYGITAQQIDNMDSGNVVVIGALTGINTDQFNPTAPTGNVNGTSLWLSPTTPGGVTTTKPSAPNHAVFVGTIVRTHQNEGVVEVRIQNGYELEELHNVSVSGVGDGEFLKYNASSQLWVASTSGDFSALSVGGTGVSVQGHSHDDLYYTESEVDNFLETKQAAGNYLTSAELSDEISTDLIASTGLDLSYDAVADSITMGLTGYTPVFNIGSASGILGINYSFARSIQTASLDGSSVTFTKGTGWPSLSGISVDVVLKLSLSAPTTVSWTIVNEWYAQPSASPLPSGTHIFLLREVGVSTIEGHYIGTRTN